MTDPHLSKIEKRAEKATPGPKYATCWQYSPTGTPGDEDDVWTISNEPDDI